MDTLQVKLSIPAQKVRAYAMDADTTMTTLSNLGVNASEAAMRDFMNYAQDAAPNTITAPSNATPVQFLQHWLPEAIRVVTKARVADRLLGRDIAGSWEQEEIVATVIEHIGQARPYGDKTNGNVAEYNVNFERRTIVRFEEDVEVGVLEEARAAAMRLSAGAEKRLASAESLAISMNDIAFNGYNQGLARTYGILNDPNLPNYTTVATGAGADTVWSSKTFNEICADLKASFAALRVQSGSNFDPYADESVLGVADAAVDMLSTMNAYGNKSVLEWLKETYPKCRVESVPQFSAANGGANVFYLFAERIGERKVVNQYVQDTLRLLGIEKKSKGFIETYSNATSGVLLAQPIGIVRYTGI